MKAFLIHLLQQRARRVFLNYHPTVVAVTGSMGKTSTKQAIEIVLATKFHVRGSKKNFNNEMGMPFTLLGVESPGRSVGKWLKVLFGPLPEKKYPNMLVMEYGADHPGDIALLCDLAQPNVSVVTGVSPVHAEYFTDIAALAEEKSTLVKRVAPGGLVFLNADDARVAAMSQLTQEKVTTYGKKGTYAIENVTIEPVWQEVYEPGDAFVVTRADVRIGENIVGQLALRNCFGYAPIMSCLAAVAVGDAFGISIETAVAALSENYHPAPGRLNPIAGIKQSLIIDDSYNAAPAAVQEGLAILRAMPLEHETGRRIAALGHMAELGKYSEDEHRALGMRVAEVADIYVAVGEKSLPAAEAAKEAGMDPNAVHWFASSIEAGRFLDSAIQKGDIIYVKGSQSARMEKVVKDIMAEPLRAEELLVRQDEKWLRE